MNPAVVPFTPRRGYSGPADQLQKLEVAWKALYDLRYIRAATLIDASNALIDAIRTYITSTRTQDPNPPPVFV